MKLIIAGSRTFNDYNLMKSCLDPILSLVDEDIEIISGRAKGADQLGEKYAMEYGYELKLFPADWDQFGKRAGYLRNLEMAEYGTHCICFWDGKSHGTKMMIELAQLKGLHLKIVNYV